VKGGFSPWEEQGYWEDEGTKAWSAQLLEAGRNRKKKGKPGREDFVREDHQSVD